MIEALGHVPGDFQVLHLIQPHRHPVGTEGQDVGRHQHRIHVEPGRHIGIQIQTGLTVPVVGRLVGVRTVQEAFGGHAGQVPAQLRNLGDVGLAVEGDALRIEPCRQPAGGDLQRGALDAGRIGTLDQPVQVGQEVKAVGIAAAAGGNGRANGACIVAQVRAAGGGDAGEHAWQGGLGR